uniref:Uncharacterized protein n=1 Tax=Nelumbo nucifera TaxID=4432 RepID=A0A822Y0Z2_NELNU|nr:TPA_asm: hypothetical protein HUJ06_024771 [Nelumbo nucifera]
MQNTDIVYGSEDDAPEDEYYVAKASKKKEKKRQEREAQRQAEEAARESRKTKQDHYAEMRRKKDEEREAQERLLEEEARARKAKEEEAAALEFEKWKGEFSVDAEGTTESEVQDGNQGLLFDFVEYIKVFIFLVSTIMLAFGQEIQLLHFQFYISVIFNYFNVILTCELCDNMEKFLSKVSILVECQLYGHKHETDIETMGGKLDGILTM